MVDYSKPKYCRNAGPPCSSRLFPSRGSSSIIVALNKVIHKLPHSISRLCVPKSAMELFSTCYLVYSLVKPMCYRSDRTLMFKYFVPRNQGWCFEIVAYKSRLCLKRCSPLFISVCVSICLSLCLCLFISLCLSLCLSLVVSLYLSLCLSLFLSVSLSFTLPLTLFLFVPVFLTLCLSFSLSYTSVDRCTYKKSLRRRRPWLWASCSTSTARRTSSASCSTPSATSAPLTSW